MRIGSKVAAVIKNPNIRVNVIHSKSKDAWNVVGTSLGCKYKVARIPYVAVEGVTTEKLEALQHGEFIKFCFNNSKAIIDLMEGADMEKLETEIYQVLRNHNLSLKKREEVISDLLKLIKDKIPTQDE